jgi:hypothetical protein
VQLLGLGPVVAQCECGCRAGRARFTFVDEASKRSPPLSSLVWSSQCDGVVRPETAHAGTEEGITMPMSRRSFLVRGSAVAGAAAVGGGGIAAVAASSVSHPLTEEEIQAVVDQPLLVQVRDAAKGEVEILVGENEVVFTDKALVAKVLRAAS